MGTRVAPELLAVSRFKNSLVSDKDFTLFFLKKPEFGSTTDSPMSDSSLVA